MSADFQAWFSSLAASVNQLPASIGIEARMSLAQSYDLFTSISELSAVIAAQTLALNAQTAQLSELNASLANVAANTAPKK